jgi:hypothetical protein
MRKLLLLLAVITAPVLFLWAANAQTPNLSSAPGGGHGYLIDKHIRAGLNCASCHSAAPPPQAPEMTACIGCHGSYQQIAAKTAADTPNPHASHLGEIPCAACHHLHKASEVFCNECHAFGMNPP